MGCSPTEISMEVSIMHNMGAVWGGALGLPCIQDLHVHPAIKATTDTQDSNQLCIPTESG